MTPETKEIEVEVVEIDGVTQITAPHDATDSPLAHDWQDWRHWHAQTRQLNARWWPLWILLGIIVLSLVLTIGLILGIVLLIFRMILKGIRAITS